jgi:hypothetical protein
MDYRPTPRSITTGVLIFNRISIGKIVRKLSIAET